MSLVDRLLEELDSRPEAAKRLARRLAADIASEEQLRNLLLEGLLREAATKEDLEKLEERINARIDRLEESVNSRMDKLEERLNKRIDMLNARIDGLLKWVIGLLATIWGTIVVAAIAALKLLLH